MMLSISIEQFIPIVSSFPFVCMAMSYSIGYLKSCTPTRERSSNAFKARRNTPSILSLVRWYRQQREGRGTRMFLSRYKFYALADFLRSGGMLGVISDQHASGGEKVVFFGKETRGTPLPGLLAKRAHFTMFAVAIQTVRPMRWRIRVAPVPLPVDGDTNCQLLARSVAQAVESSLLQSVEDGFWFHRRFR